jgi:hypothetical protein
MHSIEMLFEGFFFLLLCFVSFASSDSGLCIYICHIPCESLLTRPKNKAVARSSNFIDQISLLLGMIQSDIAASELYFLVLRKNAGVMSYKNIIGILSDPS